MINDLIGIYKRNEKLIKDNIYLSLGILSLGLAGYFFHFYAGRKLGPEDYGTLGALLSLLYIATIFILFIQLAITKTVSNLQNKGEDKKIVYLVRHSKREYAIYGIISAAVIMLLTPLLRYYLGINLWSPFLIIALLMTFSYILALNQGVMQGLQNFKGLSVIYLLQGTSKVGVAILIIGIGWGVAGAIGAFATSYLVAFIATLFFINKLSRSPEEHFKGSVIKKNIPLLIVLLSLSLMYSIDVILVKHYLQLAEVGYYTAISTLGKVVFFATNSVSFVMFPKISETKTERENRYLLYKSLILIALISMPIILLYFLFPSLVIGLLFGSQYLPVKDIVFLFGIVMALYSIIYTLCFYNLSLNKTKFIYILLAFNVTQIIAIMLFHQSIQQVVYIMLAFMTLLLISLFILKERKNETPIINNTGIQ